MTEERLRASFAAYARFHQHPVNKLLHYAGIPIIAFTLVGLFAKVGLALPVAALALSYQLTVSVPLTLVFGAYVALSFLLAPALPTWILWSGFALGWVFQLVGHSVYEKKSPAFLTNLPQFLVGPLWMIDALAWWRLSPPESAPVSESPPKP